MNSTHHDQLRRAAAFASMAMAVVLIMLKLITYYMSDSMSVLAALVDSTVDLMASGVTLWGVIKAQKPADPHHRYGHGKAEPLAALSQAAFVVGSAVLLVYQSGERLYNPVMPQAVPLAVGVMIFSLISTLMLLAFQRYVIKHTGSVAIRADRLHYSGDVYLNLAVLLALGVGHITGWMWVDPVLAMGVAGILIVGAWRIARHALDNLMDREMPNDVRQRIIQLVKQNPHVCGLHDLRTRHDGLRTFIEMHLEMDANLTLSAAHDIADDVEKTLRAEFIGAEILLHQEPAGLDDERLDHRISE